MNFGNNLKNLNSSRTISVEEINTLKNKIFDVIKNSCSATDIVEVSKLFDELIKIKHSESGVKSIFDELKEIEKQNNYEQFRLDEQDNGFISPYFPQFFKGPGDEFPYLPCSPYNPYVINCGSLKFKNCPPMPEVKEPKEQKEQKSSRKWLI